MGIAAGLAFKGIRCPGACLRCRLLSGWQTGRNTAARKVDTDSGEKWRRAQPIDGTIFAGTAA